jgi:methionine synthase II (cobalamin-independent)
LFGSGRTEVITSGSVGVGMGKGDTEEITIEVDESLVRRITRAAEANELSEREAIEQSCRFGLRNHEQAFD